MVIEHLFIDNFGFAVDRLQNCKRFFERICCDCKRNCLKRKRNEVNANYAKLTNMTETDPKNSKVGTEKNKCF